MQWVIYLIGWQHTITHKGVHLHVLKYSLNIIMIGQTGQKFQRDSERQHRIYTHTLPVLLKLLSCVFYAFLLHSFHI